MSKYSRHVVLCKNRQRKTKQVPQELLITALKDGGNCLNEGNFFSRGEKKEEQREKKTEHTNISRTFRNSEHQNIHVMLSYANIQIILNHQSKVVV